MPLVARLSKITSQKHQQTQQWPKCPQIIEKLGALISGELIRAVTCAEFYYCASLSAGGGVGRRRRAGTISIISDIAGALMLTGGK
jgi:hypothetical protein